MQETGSNLRVRRTRRRRRSANHQPLAAPPPSAISPSRRSGGPPPRRCSRRSSASTATSAHRQQHQRTASAAPSISTTSRLNLLPLPGFTLENFVVDEDPAFGNEPVIRANSVRATLRISSLWRRRVEFSTICFTEPSVNLVHLANGKWNLESILLHAAHIQAAPTAQKSAGPAPRFPYIEATGARLNLKLGHEKTPFSLTDADFALWLPDPQQWHLRLRSPPRPHRHRRLRHRHRPARRHPRPRRLSRPTSPSTSTASGATSPLGQASLLLLGHDAGLRGDMTLSANAQGTLGSNTITSHLSLTALRRADFVPERRPSVDIQCEATAANTFHSFTNLQCTWPPTGSTQPIALIATIPDVRDLSTATAQLGTPALSIPTTLDWLRTASSRIPSDLTATGTLSGSAELPSGLTHLRSQWDTQITAAFQIPALTLESPTSGLPPTTLGPIAIHTAIPTPAPTRPHRRTPTTPLTPPTRGLQLDPTTLPLGGKDPATLDGHIDATGYTLHLTGNALLSQLIALGRAIPQFGDGLEDILPTTLTDTPTHIDLTATHPWGSTQTWQDNTTHPTQTHPRKSH